MRHIAWRAILAGALGVALLFGCGALVMVWDATFLPWRQQIERDVAQESRQYVESQQTFMLQKLSAIEELQAEIAELEAAEQPNEELIAAKESQIKAFTREIRERAALIDDGEVPQTVKDYLAEVEAEREGTE
jgi:TolA-binding protein